MKITLKGEKQLLAAKLLGDGTAGGLSGEARVMVTAECLPFIGICMEKE
jgi:hypothetical protein